VAELILVRPILVEGATLACREEAREAFFARRQFPVSLRRTILINSTRGPFNFGKCGHRLDRFDCGRIRFA